ncbi:MAG: tetratricopeptide repeat protein [Tahibacter sp.]
MNPSRLVLAFLLSITVASVWAAEALLKPLPQPDLSHMDKARADTLQTEREEFEKVKRGLVGPPLADAFAQIGASYARAGLVEIAQVAMANAAALSAPGDGRWIYLQGVLAQGRQPAAVVRDYFERAFAQDGKYVPIRVALVSVLIEADELERARKLVDDGIVQAKDEPRLHALRGEIALKQRRTADAVAALEEATRLDPNASLAFAQLADAYTAKGNSTAAAAARSKAGKVPTRLTDMLAAGVSSSDVMAATADAPAKAGPADPLDQAVFFISVHQYTAARAQLDTALKANPDDPALNALYARVDAMAGNSGGARTRLESAMRRSGNNPLLFLTRGLVSEINSDESAARSDYQKALASDPKLAEARRLLGNNLMRAGKPELAVEQYRQLLQLEPAKPENQARLSAAEVAAGHCSQALRDIDTALREHPRQAGLTQLFVRLASTCPGTGETERGMALDYGKRLYAQLPTPANTEALALAAAAAGRFDDAVQLQGSAIFSTVRDGGEPAAKPYRDFFKRFEAKQAPDRPWPADHPYFKPPPLRVEAEAAAAEHQ